MLCKGGRAEAKLHAEWIGPRDCRVAQNTQNGSLKACSYGCLGLGTCVAACPFDAMYMDENGLPVVIEEKCTGCGMCVRACPRDIIVLAEEPQGVHIRCRSLALGKTCGESAQWAALPAAAVRKNAPSMLLLWKIILHASTMISALTAADV